MINRITVGRSMEIVCTPPIYLKVRVCMVQNVYVVDSELGENVLHS